MGIVNFFLFACYFCNKEERPNKFCTHAKWSTDDAPTKVPCGGDGGIKRQGRKRQDNGRRQ